MPQKFDPVTHPLIHSSYIVDHSLGEWVAKKVENHYIVRDATGRYKETYVFQTKEFADAFIRVTYKEPSFTGYTLTTNGMSSSLSSSYCTALYIKLTDNPKTVIETDNPKNIAIYSDIPYNFLTKYFLKKWLNVKISPVKKEKK